MKTEPLRWGWPFISSFNYFMICLDDYKNMRRKNGKLYSACTMTDKLIQSIKIFVIFYDNTMKLEI